MSLFTSKQHLSIKVGILLGGLAALPIGSTTAATIDTAQSVLNGNLLTSDTGNDGNTNFQIEVKNTDEMVLHMNASPTATGESFNIFFKNQIAPKTNIDFIRLGFEKINGTLPTPPAAVWWSFSVTNLSGARSTSVDSSSSLFSVPTTGGQRVDVDLPLTGNNTGDPGSSIGDIIRFSLQPIMPGGAWQGFNDPKSDWRLYIDLNEDSPTPSLPNAVPVPPALLLFGSAIVGIFGWNRKKQENSFV
ncbi:MAG: hypothetical protein AXA67_05715 [Methylothermaceae bacteria B42]|nr:MAG: hypothetical protein AXA67_05715 [Methylothermaceae bacteria B42]HHJ38701.1 hypothetical protein [Methylothermaceae bacterium]